MALEYYKTVVPIVYRNDKFGEYQSVREWRSSFIKFTTLFVLLFNRFTVVWTESVPSCDLRVQKFTLNRHSLFFLFTINCCSLTFTVSKTLRRINDRIVIKQTKDSSKVHPFSISELLRTILHLNNRSSESLKVRCSQILRCKIC